MTNQISIHVAEVCEFDADLNEPSSFVRAHDSLTLNELAIYSKRDAVDERAAFKGVGDLRRRFERQSEFAEVGQAAFIFDFSVFWISQVHVDLVGAFDLVAARFSSLNEQSLLGGIKTDRL